MMGSLHVLGGGPAGLAASHRAAGLGGTVRLYEAGSEVGGNCRTLRIGDCLFDTGAHRLHAHDPEATRAFRELLGDALFEVRAPSRIVRDGRSYLFPPAPLDLIRNLPPRQLARAGRDWLLRPRAVTGNFRAHAAARYGRTLADLFLLGYTRKLWGRDPSELSPAVAGGRLKGLDAAGLFAERILRRRRHLDGAFLYPRDGIGMLPRALEARLPAGTVRTNSRITRIRHDGARILAVEINGTREESVERVVSTLPLPALLRVLDPAPPADLLVAAEGLAFRSLVLCVLRLGMERFSGNASLYFPDPDVPFTRLYEPKNRSASMAPPHETCVVLEFPCDPDDATWRSSDAEITGRAVAALVRATGFDRGTVLESAVHRAGQAYPILERGAEARVAALLAYCARFSNLRLAGRNALFRYAHLHDMLRQGAEAAEALA